ncbi:MAG: hypothetical protein LBU51_09765 [Bacteroidales bacterium]|jgi:hypothetical protein|nr:hypothetical protein [Bacteroidales bacterium]
MKKVDFLLLLLAAILLFSACDRDPVTYKFDKNDADKLLPHYTVGKILTFRNEVGEERKFEVSEITHKINQDWIFVGMGGTNMYYFFYESKGIDLFDIASQKKIGIKIWSYPIDQEKARNNIYHVYKSHLTGVIVDIYTPLNFEQNQLTRNINGTTYKNVFEISRTVLSYDPTLIYNEIDVIYYDLYYGIIEFHDKNDHQWKLVN